MPDLSRYAAVISYRRFSSRKQRRGHSEERQADAAAAWAAEHGITLSPLSATDRGLSAFHGKHRQAGALGTLLAALEDRKVPTPALLVIEAADRLSRLPSTEGLQMIFSGLLGQGCDLLVLERQQLFTRDSLDNDMGQLVQLTIDISAAHAFSTRLSKRMKAAHEKGRERIAAGEVTRAGWSPAWIELHDGQWRLTPYAATIRRLLALSETLGANAVAKQLNREGLPSPRGRKWTNGGVSSVLASPALAGGRPTRRRDADGVVWGYWPAIISRAEWEALRRRITARDGSPAHGGNQQAVWFLGQGVCICSTCGRPVGNRVASYASRQSGGRIKVRYARCRGRGDGQCSQPALRLDPVNATILTRLAAADLSRLFPQQGETQLQALQSREGVLRGQIEQQQAAVANGRDAIARLLQHAPESVDAVAQAVTAADGEQKRLQGELRAVRLEVEQLLGNGRGVLADELQEQVEKLLQSFARGEDSADQRKAVNGLLRRLDVRLQMDAAGQRLGIAIGDAEPSWQPIHPALSRLALEQGQPGVSYGRIRIPASELLRAGELLDKGTPADEITLAGDGDIEPGEGVAMR